MGRPRKVNTTVPERTQENISKRPKRKKCVKDDSTKPDNQIMLKQKFQEERGLVYVGRIPPGIYGKDLKSHFNRFGKITNVKMCRSGTSGNSKRYGYVEFESPEIARTAAETMNNYVVCNKRILTEYIPNNQRPEGLFNVVTRYLGTRSAQTKRATQNYSPQKIRYGKPESKKARKCYQKAHSKVPKLRRIGVQCSLISVNKSDKANKSDKVIKEIKLERKSVTNANSEEYALLNDIIIFKKPSSKEIPLNNANKSSSSNYSSKSLSGIKSNKPMLTKSLDSVKAILNRSSSGYQDQETQTPELRVPKTERGGRKSILKRGLGKIKKEKNVLNLDPVAVKKIARELIRKRGNPLITLTKSGN